MNQSSACGCLAPLALFCVGAISAQGAQACVLNAVRFTTSAHATASHYDPRALEAAQIFLKPEFGGEESPGDCAKEPITVRMALPGSHELEREGGGGVLVFRFLNDGAVAQDRPFMEILRNQFALAGDYRGKFQAALEKAPLQVVEEDLVVTATPITHFVHGAFSTVIDFGRIGDGSLTPRADQSVLEKTVDFVYQANIPARVTLESRGGGYLRLEKQPNLTPIPYKVRLNNTPFEIGTGHDQTLAMKFGQGELGKITILLSDVKGLAAGTYSDLLTITFTPNY